MATHLSSIHNNEHILSLQKYLHGFPFAHATDLLLFVGYLKNSLFQNEPIPQNYPDYLRRDLRFICNLLGRVQTETPDPKKEQLIQLFHQTTQSFVTEIVQKQKEGILGEEILQRQQQEEQRKRREEHYCVMASGFGR
jgi:hypothetical protein